MKRELEHEIENIEKNEAVESLNESFVEDMLEEHNEAGVSIEVFGSLRVCDRPEASVSHHGVLGISFQLSNN